MGKAEKCSGNEQSGRKGARQGSGGSKKGGLKGRGVKAEFPYKEPEAPNSYDKVSDLLMKTLMPKVFGPCLSKTAQKTRPTKVQFFGTFSRSIRDWINLEFSHSNI